MFKDSIGFVQNLGHDCACGSLMRISITILLTMIPSYGIITEKERLTAKDNEVFQFTEIISRGYKYFCFQNRTT